MIYIFIVLTFFAVLGAIDRCFNLKLGYGDKFQEGINVTGPLVLAMVGILSLSPVISKSIKPFVEGLYSLTGIDPSIYVNSFLALDMGGYFLAKDLAINKEIINFSGLILGSMLGTVVIFTMPVAFGVISDKSKDAFSKGILSGIATIPLGCLVSGLLMGLKLPLVLYNLIPVVFIASAISFGLWFAPEKTCKIFNLFGKFMTILISFGLILTMVEVMLNIKIIDDLNPIEDSMSVIIRIALTLAGAFPFLHFINRYFSRVLSRFGKILGMDDAGVSGFMASLVNSIPMFGIFEKMDDDSKIINSAFAVGGAYVFGGQLGFVGGISPETVVPFIVGKLVAGFSAIYLAKVIFIRKKGVSNEEEREYGKVIF